MSNINDIQREASNHSVHACEHAYRQISQLSQSYKVLLFKLFVFAFIDYLCGSHSMPSALDVLKPLIINASRCKILKRNNISRPCKTLK